MTDFYKESVRKKKELSLWYHKLKKKKKTESFLKKYKKYVWVFELVKQWVPSGDLREEDKNQGFQLQQHEGETVTMGAHGKEEASLKWGEGFRTEGLIVLNFEGPDSIPESLKETGNG